MAAAFAPAAENVMGAANDRVGSRRNAAIDRVSDWRVNDSR